MHNIPYSTEILQQHCKNISLQDCNITKILQNITAIFQQHCSNVKMSVLKTLIRNITAILQYNIYAILGFAHNEGILAETL